VRDRSGAGQLIEYRTKVKMLTSNSSFSLKEPRGGFHVMSKDKVVQLTVGLTARRKLKKVLSFSPHPSRKVLCSSRGTNVLPD